MTVTIYYETEPQGALNDHENPILRVDRHVDIKAIEVIDRYLTLHKQFGRAPQYFVELVHDVKVQL